jgi:hypothetical protein
MEEVAILPTADFGTHIDAETEDAEELGQD